MALSKPVLMDDGKAERKLRGRANSIDVYVGSRVRTRRTLLGLSQQKLGAALGLTFQQVQKYERGSNRIGASRLFELGRILDVPISYFYEELPESDIPENWNNARTDSEEQHPAVPNMIHKRETLELVRGYYRIENPKLRKQVYELVKTLGGMKA